MNLKCWAIIAGLLMPLKGVAEDYTGLKEGPQVSVLVGHNFGHESTVAQNLGLSVSFTKGDNFLYLPRIELFFQQANFDSDKIDATTADKRSRSAAMGIRAGAAFPTKAFVLPMQFYAGLAYAETTTQKQPWWGQPEDAIDTTPLYQAEVGLSFHYKVWFLKYAFGISNLEYLEQSHYLSLGTYL